jgi:hypothetical protein
MMNAPVVYKKLVITHNPFNILSINEEQSNWCNCKPDQRQSSLDQRAFRHCLGNIQLKAKATAVMMESFWNCILKYRFTGKINIIIRDDCNK